LFYWYQYLPDEQILYVQYNLCRESETQTFADFADEVMSVFQTQTVSKFVFDMRNNPRGSSSIAQPLIQDLAQHPAINQEGHLFVVVGRRTFSSAILNSVELMNDTQAILVGEPTGGKPNHYGEVKDFTLPHSGLTVTYSTKYFEHITGDDPESLVPDILVELSSEQYFAAQDPVLERIVAYPD